MKRLVTHFIKVSTLNFVQILRVYFDRNPTKFNDWKPQNHRVWPISCQSCSRRRRDNYGVQRVKQSCARFVRKENNTRWDAGYRIIKTTIK